MKITCTSLILFYLVCHCSVVQAEEAVPSPTEQLQQQPPKHGCVVFTDMSFNMRGFFSPDKSSGAKSAVQRYLQTELRNFISENKLSPALSTSFGNELSTKEQSIENIGSNFSYKTDKEIKDFFKYIHCDLTGVFKEGSQLDMYSGSIIVTDGIQCTENGFDIGLMINILESAIKRGLHLYLFGIEAEFDGFVLPLHSHASPFWHKGKRPFYIWIVTHDTEHVNKLKRDMERRIGLFTDNFRSVGFTDISLPVARVTLDNDQGKSRQRNYITIPRADDIVELKLRNRLRGKIDIPIVIESDNTDKKGYHNLRIQLEPLVDWAEIIESEGRWLLSLNCDRVPSSGFFGGKSHSDLRIKMVATPDANKWWWKEWSTDNITTRDDADKTLYLDRIGKRLLEPVYNKTYDIGFVTLRIDK